jgi:hypothetical protein
MPTNPSFNVRLKTGVSYTYTWKGQSLRFTQEMPLIVSDPGLIAQLRFLPMLQIDEFIEAKKALKRHPVTGPKRLVPRAAPPPEPEPEPEPEPVEANDDDVPMEAEEGADVEVEQDEAPAEEPAADEDYQEDVEPAPPPAAKSGKKG